MSVINAGVYISDFVNQYAWTFVSVAIILAIRPTIKYFMDNDLGGFH